MRKEQKELRRTEILQAGLELFVRKGYAATKITDIAEEANMSTGLLFHYFESKEKLYEELVDFGLQSMQANMSMVYESPIDYFEKVIHKMFTNMRENPWTAKMFVLMVQAYNTDGIPKQVGQIATQADHIERSVNLIQQGQQDGTIRKGDPLALSVAFWCTLQGVAERIALRSDTPFPEPEWLLDVIRNKGVLPREK